MTEADFVESWMRFLTSVPSCPYRILPCPDDASSSSLASEDGAGAIIADDKDYYLKVVRRIEMLATGALALPNYARNEAA